MCPNAAPRWPLSHCNTDNDSRDRSLQRTFTDDSFELTSQDFDTTLSRKPLRGGSSTLGSTRGGGAKDPVGGDGGADKRGGVGTSAPMRVSGVSAITAGSRGAGDTSRDPLGGTDMVLHGSIAGGSLAAATSGLNDVSTGGAAAGAAGFTSSFADAAAMFRAPYEAPEEPVHTPEPKPPSPVPGT